MDERTKDDRFIARGLELARQAVGLAAPNPHVGAIVVSDAGEVLGEGIHTYTGRKHAEIVALEKAGERARGATLYLNLEPCCHQGRTGPCVEAIIAAGVRRVVASIADPNPVVSGKGFEKLRAAGIEVVVGPGEPDARKLNEAFAKFIRTGSPLVTLKSAMSLDGKIAPPPGESTTPTALGAEAAQRGYITSKLARAHVHELRHASDAILVGVGTVVADDPLLTDRTGLPRRRPLLRVIVDSRLRLSLDSRVVKTAKDDVVVFCSFADDARRRKLEQRGIRVEQIQHAGMAGRPDLSAIVRRLGEMQITSLMIEGGSLVNWAAISADIVDKVWVYYAPLILGGTGAVSFATGPGFRKLKDAIHLHGLALHRLGEDFAVEGYVRDPYESAADAR